MYDSPACEAVNADCLKCPKAVDNLILYASHSRGFHFIMPKCDNNIIMFLLKGEALVNSEEYAGVTLHAGEFILQAVGSKYEVLAMTDVECVCYRFSQPESFCEGRFQHIVKDVVPPLIFFPLKICSELNFFLEASKSYLVEGKTSREQLQFKQKELAFILWRYYSDYEPSMFVDCAQAKDLVDNNTVVVVVDTNKPSYTECQDLLYMTKTIVVLDHHRRGSEVIQNAVLSYVEPYASSSCEMIAEILQYFADGLKLRSIEADCIYAGIMIDTNNFTTRAGVRTFEAAAFLRRCGADVTRVRKMLRDNIDSYKARAEAVRTAEIYRDYFAIARCPSEGLESPTVVGAQAANELLNIAGVKASFVLTSYNNEVYISARAIDEVNVQVMMERMGGGGHLNIAGAQVKDTMDETERMLKEIIDQLYQEGEREK